MHARRIESHGDPAQRGVQTKRLLDAIDAYAPAQPVVVGGDFNTSTLDRAWARGNGEKPTLPVARVLDPTPYEPLFETMREYRYDWSSCNAEGIATQRTRPDGTPKPPLGKLDWFFARDVAASDASTLAAVDADGEAISDHDILMVTVAASTPETAAPPRTTE